MAPPGWRHAAIRPRISDAAVIGVLDAEGGEAPKAFVVTQRDADLDTAGVIDFVADRVARYKKVREVEFIDVIAKSAPGTILREDLRARQRTV